jgi:gluconate 2-dehydrogenase gamma chain
MQGIAAAWATTHCPAALAAVQHAREMAQPGAAPRFDYFSPQQAAEVESLVARIIPADDTPGAREAGVVYFIDRALATFAKSDRKLYEEGLAEVQAQLRHKFPDVPKFSMAGPAQQDEVLRSLDDNAAYGGRPFGNHSPGQSFFETLRQHAIAGFLIDPESDRRGNRDAIGWQVIGREREHMFQPPFGHYDRDYPGWQPGGETEESQTKKQ